MHGPLSQQLFLLATDVYRYSEQPFTLASGGQSHHYFNCKKITLQPERLSLLARVIRDEVIAASGLSVPEACGGLTLGADPVAIALSLAYQEKTIRVWPLIVRKETKDHGTKRKIEGEYENVREVLVLDDVVTTAGSTIKAVDAFREAGIIVRHALCIIDREEGGREALKAKDVELLSVFKKSDFLGK